MKSIGKITQLPPEILDELHQRIQNKEKQKSLLQWLNALPQVKALLAEKYEGQPISKQNLSEYKTHSYRNWLLRQEALYFVKNAQTDDAELQKAANGQLSGILSRWVATRYATLAQAVSADSTDPETEMRRLNLLCNHITALRRGDLTAERLTIEQQRLAIERVRSDDEMEELHWEWTKRPDVNAKLYPHRDPDKLRREVDRMISHQMLGIPLRPEPVIPDDPACYI
jgi:hypothetical protein